MYLGKLVETGESQEIFRHPVHPYTKALLAAVPEPDPDRRNPRLLLKGEAQFVMIRRPSPVRSTPPPPRSFCWVRTRSAAMC